MENRDFGQSDPFVIHVGTNDVRRSRILDDIMGEVYDLVNTAKGKITELQTSVYWCFERQQMGDMAANDRLEWVARSVGATFVEPNCWIRDLDFGMDGLHLNRNGARELGDRHCRVCGIDGESRKVLSN